MIWIIICVIAGIVYLSIGLVISYIADENDDLPKVAVLVCMIFWPILVIAALILHAVLGPKLNEYRRRKR